MNKPGYNSSIEDKIRWLEWFQSKREINDLETLSKYCNINVLKTDNSPLERVKTQILTEEQRISKAEKSRIYYYRRKGLPVPEKRVKLTEEEKKIKKREKSKKHYYKHRGEVRVKMSDEERRIKRNKCSMNCYYKNKEKNKLK